MRKTKSTAKQLGGLAIFAVAAIVAYSGHRVHARAAHISGSIWTKEQICKHALPLIQALAPEQNEIAIESNESTGYRGDGTPQHLCFVDSTGDPSGHAIHTVWDADTGKLMQVGRHPAAATEMQMVVLDARGAEAIARQWLQKLGMVQNVSAWQLARPSSVCTSSCTIFLQHEKQHVAVIVQRRTHDLSYACLTDMPVSIQQKRLANRENSEYISAQENCHEHRHHSAN